MKLYSAPLSPFAARVRLSIYRKGLDIEIVPPPADGLKSAEYLAVNPMGQIPALQLDSGHVIPDSGAILEYLEDLFPTPSLRPDSFEDLARARLFMRIPDVQFNSAPRILLGMRKPEDRKPERVAPAFENLERALDNVQHFIDDDGVPGQSVARLLSRIAPLCLCSTRSRLWRGSMSATIFSKAGPNSITIGELRKPTPSMRA